MQLNDVALVHPLALGGEGPSVVVKDCFDIAGTVTGIGSEAYSDALPAESNARVIENVLNAGCRIIGKANMHELAFGMTGVNNFYGTPVNPRWPELIPGGSSSGSAVAVAAGWCDFAIGTDTGGSIRQPATCCGVFGFKPTFGRLSHAGIKGSNSSLDCAGPIARDIDMIETAMKAMDPSFFADNLQRKPRIGRINISSKLGPEILHLLRSFASLPVVELKSLDAAFDAAMIIIGYETALEYGHLLDTRSPLGEDVALRLGEARKITEQSVSRAEVVRKQFCKQVDELLLNFDALLLPAMPDIPPTINSVRNKRSVLWTTQFLRPFNLSGHPAITIPFLSKNGWPVGMQLVGKKNEDAKLCAIARQLKHTSI